jgi:hypothetical protein
VIATNNVPKVLRNPSWRSDEPNAAPEWQARNLGWLSREFDGGLSTRGAG